MSDQEIVKNYVDHIEDHLNAAFSNSILLQKFLLEKEGDSDLHRKLQMYLVPNLNHWLVGAQAGNIRDLRETLARRIAEKDKEMTTTQTHQGDGHDVLTKPSK